MTLVELDDEVPMQLGDFADGMSWLLTGDVCFFHHYLELYRYILIVHHILYIIYIYCLFFRPGENVYLLVVLGL